MTHNHRPASRLTIGCPACIHAVKRDQFIAGLPDLDEDEILDIVMNLSRYNAAWKSELAAREMDRRIAAGEWQQ